MRDVIVKFRYVERDVADAFRLRLWTSLRSRPELVLASLAVIGGCVAMLRAAPGARIAVAAIVAAIGLAAVAMVVIAPRVMFRRRAYLRLPVTVDASDEGLTVVLGAHGETIAWQDCKLETSARLCLIHHHDEILIVPRRAFRNEQREQAFLRLVERHASRDMRALDSGKSTPSANA